MAGAEGDAAGRLGRFIGADRRSELHGLRQTEAESHMQERVAVLTGDLVKSTKTSRAHVEAVFDQLKAADARLRDDLGLPEDPPLERFRGDGWQALMRSTRHALRASLVFSAAARSVDTKTATRIAVGVGAAEQLDPAGLGASDGPAFRVSGRGLETMKRSALLTVVLDPNRDDAVWAQSAFMLAGAAAHGWSRPQAEVLQHLLLPKPPTQAELGDQFGITQQSVQDRFDNAAGGVLLEVLEHMEAHDGL